MGKPLLILQVEEVTGTSSKTNKPYAFNKYFVLVNGIELQMTPSDRTVQQVLEQYHAEIIEKA